MSAVVFWLHFFGVIAFVSCSVGSVAIGLKNPTFFAERFLPFWGAFSLATLATWPVFRGCPLTKLENYFRVREGKLPYEGQCIGHYLGEYAGLRLSGLTVNLTLVGFMLVPFAAYVIRFFLE